MAATANRRSNSLPGAFDDTSTSYFLQPGIERKWHALGKTTIFGEYRKDEAGASTGSNASGSGVGTINTRGADLTFYAGGVVQNIEAASMDLYVIYRHAEGDYLSSANTQGRHRRLRHGDQRRAHSVLIANASLDQKSRPLPGGGSFVYRRRLKRARCVWAMLELSD